MKKRSVVLSVILGIVVVIATVIGIYHNAAYMVFKNLTAVRFTLDESDEWNNGTSYLKVAYALDSESQYLDLYVPDTELSVTPKLFVLVHGGGFISGDSQTRQAQLMYRYFRDQGYACATINYRLAQEEAFPGALSDVKAAVRYLKSHADQYGYDAENIAIWGESAGGYLAVAASVTNDDEFMDVKYVDQDEIEKDGNKVSAKVKICVDYYGAVELGFTKQDDWDRERVPGIVIDIANSWLHTDVLGDYPDVESYWLRADTEKMSEEERAYSDLYTYIDENLNENSDIKFWIAHGDCDLTVPLMQSQRFYDTLINIIGENNVTFNIVKDAGHAGDIMYSDEELFRIKEYLDTNL